MKFYYCEGCGKRLTEEDLGEGLGRDKQVKGIYCSDCAYAVSTVAFQKTPEMDEAILEAEERQQQAKADREEVERVQKPPPSPPLSPRTKMMLIAAAGVLLLVAGICIGVVLTYRPPPPPAPAPAAR
ncbi:MAG: hypothetical protein KIS92_08260 [Planctomycetota bacterium]|nr:hypothetical protein [Planctomycetota bacterium]